METLIAICLFGVVYSYFLYPLILFVLPKRRVHVAEPASLAPTARMSLIITAHNEEQRIDDKLRNTFELEYPRESLEIIVASDCSTDRTDAIVESYADQGVTLVRADQHLGKEYAQWCAIQASSGEIIVFSDVATLIPADALLKLVALFDDPKVGAVSSEDRFISDDGKLAGEGAYVRYEMWLRALESRLAGLVGLSGSFFAARREVCQQWDTESPSDFNTALNCARAGFIAISSPEVCGHYKDVADEKKEYARKIRTVIRGITALGRHAEVLNPFTFGLFAFQVWSHKVMRWAVPWFMLLLFVVTLLALHQSWFIKLLFVGQVGFYGLALLGSKSAAWRENSLVRLIYYFVQVNMALAHATVSYFSGKRMTTWTPSQR